MPTLPKPVLDTSLSPPIDARVDVGGHRLLQAGAGGSTVVFEAGGASGSLVFWSRQPRRPPPSVTGESLGFTPFVGVREGLLHGEPLPMFLHIGAIAASMPTDPR